VQSTQPAAGVLCRDGGSPMRLVSLTLLCALPCTANANAQSTPELTSCPASQLVTAAAPIDPNADPIAAAANWYINADRTIWAGPLPVGGWTSGGTVYTSQGAVQGEKTYWVRPQGTQLTVTGRRLDASASPVQSIVPCCYPTGFQIVALLFPTAGCWEISAKAGDRELRFVTQVKPATPVWVR